MSSNRVEKLLSFPHIFMYFTAVDHEVTSTVKITPLWLLFWCLRQGQYQIGQFADYSSSGVQGDIFYPHCLSYSSRNPIVIYVTHMHIYHTHTDTHESINDLSVMWFIYLYIFDIVKYITHRSWNDSVTFLPGHTEILNNFWFHLIATKSINLHKQWSVMKVEHLKNLLYHCINEGKCVRLEAVHAIW